ncbi:NADH:ubiquinone oxidoreductase [Prosthecochloris sp. N3]|uniref:NADH:ubiquinone oxidoreductase n=1 Tax=Prosthecochloris ethylica TaxID=2743976 RepID=A0ABR9XP61_9CHLB|nr:NADH:ubiquinone oxidoreductase [Prosthecochloris sp. ZM_2]MBF0585747.1 NADH:ubiquinone oxidoreductase [Prosthecochloris ethylica]MEC9486551.1 NADH:ubiquinone oxidoreductase [Prosthecochloris sp.]MBF0635657.1 NADH:ubiquinone oxidoreductase [Prosthecochloris ethylica]NUK46956.1 NADH:ubiquinone oxidoreductase [Prosthecochloris ethylica]RNA65448.1 NADH:ubiquinone oxidoreductase [Prosthecochloris sp. ZM_2]
MQHLGFSTNKLKIGSFDFTCCEGCQLQLANKEETLPEFLDLLDIRNFREISSERFDDYDIALVEGSISRSDEVERLQAIRKQAKILIAYGSCACFGGVNSLKNHFPPDECVHEVYGDSPVETLPVRRISDVVKVDFSIPGCPVSKDEVERIVVSIATGAMISLPKYPVCVECKQQLNTCLFDLGEVCLGPITRAGCNAVCTTGKTACLGCRGPAEDINYRSFRELVKEHGLSLDEMEEKLRFYNCFEEFRDDES